MKTANDFARIDAQLTDMAELLKAPEGDVYYFTRHLAIYHLRAAASIARQIAETLADKERQG